MKRFLAATETVAAVFLLLIAVLTAGNVVLRGLFAVQIPDWYDGATLLMCIALFWGIAVATYHGGHICVDAVWEQLKARNRRRMDVAAAVVTLAFLVPLAWMVWVKVLSSGSETTADLRLPMVWFYVIAAAGAVAAAVLAVRRIWDLVRGTEPGARDAAELPHGS